MKSNNLLKIIAIASSLALVTGCNDNKDKGSTNNGGGGGGGGSGTAPADVSNKLLLTVQVSSGTPVFKDHGSYTFLSDNGAGTLAPTTSWVMAIYPATSARLRITKLLRIRGN